MRSGHAKELRWKQAAGQFILIVVGVLVALYADSLRETRSDRNREAAYVADLLTDLETTLTMLDRSIAFDSIQVLRARYMLTYLRSNADAPVDSIRGWRGLAWPGFAVVTGTVHAVLQTGDLRLLSAGMRRSLTAYSTDLEYAEREIERAVGELAAANRVINEREEVHIRWGPLDSIAGRTFTVNGRGMREDPVLRAAYTAGVSWGQFHLGRLLDFRVVVLGFRDVLQAEAERLGN